MYKSGWCVQFGFRCVPCVQTVGVFSVQLQVLVDDSARLQQTYPGGNADQIAQQQAVVVENWTILQERASQHKFDLQAAMDLYRFLAQVGLTGRLAGWLVGWPASWPAGWLAGWPPGWLATWLADWLAGRPAGWLTGWPSGWLTGWPPGWPPGCPAGRLAIWLADWPRITNVRILYF